MIRKIRLDADSRCQLHCPLCPTGDGRNRGGVIGWGHLTLERFERILELNPTVESVELSNWGEIFLNPELEQILWSAHRRGVALMARNGVHFNRVSDRMLRTLVEAELRHLTISIDGATPEVYAEFRRGGRLEDVLENIRALNRLKRAAGSRYPELRWQFIAFGHNEHEIEPARKLALELDMTFYVKLNASPDYSPVKDREHVARLSGTGAGSRDDYRRIAGRPYSLPCSQLDEEPQINWNGVVLGCCRNFTTELGDALAVPLDECRAGELYAKTRRIAAMADESPEGTPCASCGIYRTEILPRVGAARAAKAR